MASFLTNLQKTLEHATEEHERKQKHKNQVKTKTAQEIKDNDLDLVKQRNIFTRHRRKREDRKAERIDNRENRIEKIRQAREDRRQARRDFKDYITNNGGIRESIRHQLNTTQDNVRHRIELTGDKIKDNFNSRIDIIKNHIEASKEKIADATSSVKKVFTPGGLKNVFEEKADNIKSRIENKAAAVKTNITESKVGQLAKKTKAFFKTKGLKDKAKFLGDNTKIGGFIKKLGKLAKAIGKFITTFWKPIVIIFLIVDIGILLSNAIFYGISLSQSIGETPHYYCNPKTSIMEQMSSRYKQYCTYQTFDNSSIAAAAVALSTADRASGQPKIDYTSPGLSDLLPYAGANVFVSVVPRIVQTMVDRSQPGQSWSTNTNSALYASCDFSVCMAILWSGADDNYPSCLGRELHNTGTTANTQVQTGYLLASDFNNGLWKELTEGDEILPGDVAVSNYTKNGESKGHTWIYVAHWVPEPTASNPWAGHWENSEIVQAKYPGSNANRYEGSHESYYACLSHTDNNPWQDARDAMSDPDHVYKIFRFVGSINEGSPFIGITP